MTPQGNFADPAGGPSVGVDRHGADMHATEHVAISILEAVPDWMWDCSPPIPVERIAEDQFGLLVCEAEDPATVPGAPPVADGNHLSGFLHVGKGQIWINAADAREWPPRRRFTIAHELGHWVMHRDLAELRFREGGRAGEVLPIHEAEANAFAAALLMPAALLRPSFDRLRGNIEKLQAEFDSSKAAMERRLVTLGLVPA